MHTPIAKTALPPRKQYHLRIQHFNVTAAYLKCSGMKMIKDDLLQIGFNFLHFTENNTTLTFDLLLPQNAVLDDV